MPQFVNTDEKHTVDLKMIGLGRVKPGETVEIPEGLARPERKANGSRRPSVVERVAPQLRPVDETWAAEFDSTPEPAPVQSRLRGAHGPVAAGTGGPIAPGVAAARKAKAERAKAKVEAKPDETESTETV